MQTRGVNKRGITGPQRKKILFAVELAPRPIFFVHARRDETAEEHLGRRPMAEAVAPPGAPEIAAWLAAIRPDLAVYASVFVEDGARSASDLKSYGFPTEA